MNQESNPPVIEEPVRGEGFPWPPAPATPILQAFFETLRRSTLSPAEFFRAMPVRGGLGMPLLYYLVIGIVVAAISLFWQSVRLVTIGPGEETVYQMLGLSADPGLLLLIEFLLAPLYLLVALFLAAGVIHLVLLVVGGAREGFEATARVLTFAYSPLVLSIVPVIGPVVGSIWMVVVAIIGLRAAHRTETWRAVVAVLLPFALAFTLVVIGTFLAAMTGLLPVTDAGRR